jgi:hypothetical protein
MDKHESGITPPREDLLLSDGEKNLAKYLRMYPAVKKYIMVVAKPWFMKRVPGVVSIE